MPRPPRLFLENVPQHLTQRGNNRQKIFFAPEDGQRYLDWLGELSNIHYCRLHAYVLMPNHIHLLLTPGSADSVPAMMQKLNARYGRYVNKTQNRTGTLWDGRYHAAMIDSDNYLLACYRYIELNPVRAGLAETPGAYRWSSFRGNGAGAGDPLLTPHPLFKTLIAGTDGREAYCQLVAGGLTPEQYARLHASSYSGRAVGSDHFLDQLEVRTGQSARDRRVNRP